jgi:VWFA-related protein
MAGNKIQEARTALDRLLFDLLDRQDEIFLYRFSSTPVLLQQWTRDRQQLSRALAHVEPNGGTAMYDAVAESIPLTLQGQNRKKALLVISDGNDTSSIGTLRDVRDALRDSEVLVYAVGIDGDSVQDRMRQPPMRPRVPPPMPFPPARGPRGRFPIVPQIFGPGGRQFPRNMNDDRVNSAALRDMTDDSGGRTEIVRSGRDLDPATTSIADELSKQYAIGYASTAKKDGRWHSIRVEVRNRAYRVRARRGYVAS